MAAILSVTEQPEGWDGGRNDKGEYEFARVFFVLTETLNVGPFAVLSAQDPNTGVAIPGDFEDYHAGDDALSYAYVKNKKAKRDSVQPRLWYVTVNYSTAKETQERQVAENPLDRPVEVTWQTENRTRIAVKDRDGDPIATSAGEAIKDVEVDDGRLTVTLVKNFATFNSLQAEQYKDAVNSDEFLSRPPGTAKVMSFSAVKQFENAVTYWKTSCTIAFNEDTWAKYLLDEGTYYLADDGKRKKFRDKDGHFITSLLDGSGGALADGDTPVFIAYEVYKEKSFNALNFGV